MKSMFIYSLNTLLGFLLHNHNYCINAVTSVFWLCEQVLEKEISISYMDSSNWSAEHITVLLADCLCIHAVIHAKACIEYINKHTLQKVQYL